MRENDVLAVLVPYLMHSIYLNLKDRADWIQSTLRSSESLDGPRRHQPAGYRKKAGRVCTAIANVDRRPRVVSFAKS